MQNIKNNFPIFKKNKKLVYLDSGATSLKPKCVIEVVNAYNSEYSANVHRGIYKLSERATEEYEKARKQVANFIHANPCEVIFVRNTTEAINIVAYVWGEENIHQGDNIVTSIMEHHSNFVPWQELTKRKGITLRIIDIKDDGTLNMDDLRKKIDSSTKLLAITQVSNVLGTINPIKKIVSIAKKYRAKVLVDGAQAVPHLSVDVKDLDCDFYAFSAHKMLGPTGVGALWARQKILDKMSPFLFGGSMIEKVTQNSATFNHSPEKFEAGTPDISGAIGFGEAADYLTHLGMKKIAAYEDGLKKYAYQKLAKVKGVTIYGPCDLQQKCAVFAFNIEGIHPHDLATLLDEDEICVRAGHHCAMPLHTHLGLTASVRASFYIYNTKDDVDKLVKALKKAQKLFNS